MTTQVIEFTKGYLVTEEEKQENARIVAALARFYDRLIDKGGLVDGNGRPLSDATVTAVLAEAGLAEEHRVAPLLGQIKARVSNGGSQDLTYHRERLFLAEYYEKGAPSAEKQREADSVRRYAQHYDLGIARARTMHVDPRPATRYPTAEQLATVNNSRYRQVRTLGLTEFAQPQVAEARDPELARQRAEVDAAYQRQAVEAYHQEAAVFRQQEAARRQAEAFQQQAEAARRQQALAAYQQAPAPAAYQHIPAAYCPGGAYPTDGVFAAPAPAAASHATTSHLPPQAFARSAAPVPVPVPRATTSHLPPQAFARSAAHVPSGVRAPGPAVSQVVPYGTAYGTQYVPAPNQRYGSRPTQ
ncbi:hypothetical protein OG226_49420 [Streptomyces sp. NBC_01261]|uniref:hypothetical protein n=1 Tax=Streptomyces sp. NBC_01261 TaxID=2903802 RepID=UPI002E354410|nr:hypothetical protein [Streptomyces sp. NBC_01261]